MNTYVFRYRELSDPEDVITNSIQITAPDTHTAWELFELAFSPKHFVAVGITYRSELLPA